MASEANVHEGSSITTAREERAVRPVRAELRRLERLFSEVDWSDRRSFTRARKRARMRALEVLEGAGASAHAAPSVLLVAAGELFAGLEGELEGASERVARLLHDLEDDAGISAIALAREVLRAPELLTLLPADAVRIQLARLATLAPLRGASLWALDDAEHVSCVCHAGEIGPSRGAKELARRLLAGEGAASGDAHRRLLIGVPVGRWQVPLAVLVGSVRPGAREACSAFLAEAAPMLGAVLERDALLAGNAASERALVESSERKLTRLGFDLHDGPIQDVTALAEDLRFFQGQLEVFVAAPAHYKLVRRRIEGFIAQLATLEAELRRISNEVNSASIVLNRPFGPAVRDIARAFAARTNIEPQLTLAGDMSLVSASQQIALLNILHEALTNVREHSRATRVQIAVSANSEGVEAQVTDNGRGFDLEPTMMQAARKGRLGVIAMHERVRLLGGQCRIDSRPGGPTVVSVSLDHWEPLAVSSPPGPARLTA